MSTLEQRVKEFVAEQYVKAADPAQVHLHTRLNTDFDEEVERSGLNLDLEQDFEVTLSDEVILRLTTVQDLVDALRAAGVK